MHYEAEIYYNPQELCYTALEGVTLLALGSGRVLTTLGVGCNIGTILDRLYSPDFQELEEE